MKHYNSLSLCPGGTMPIYPHSNILDKILLSKFHVLALDQNNLVYIAITVTQRYQTFKTSQQSTLFYIFGISKSKQYITKEASYRSLNISWKHVSTTHVHKYQTLALAYNLVHSLAANGKTTSNLLLLLLTRNT